MMDRDIRVVVFEDGDHYIAQALEVDIAAQGRTAEEAYRRLGIAINAEVREAAEEISEGRERCVYLSRSKVGTASQPTFTAGIGTAEKGNRAG